MAPIPAAIRPLPAESLAGWLFLQKPGQQAVLAVAGLERFAPSSEEKMDAGHLAVELHSLLAQRRVAAILLEKLLIDGEGLLQDLLASVVHSRSRRQVFTQTGQLVCSLQSPAQIVLGPLPVL